MDKVNVARNTSNSIATVGWGQSPSRQPGQAIAIGGIVIPPAISSVWSCPLPVCPPKPYSTSPSPSSTAAMQGPVSGLVRPSTVTRSMALKLFARFLPRSNPIASTGASSPSPSSTSSASLNNPATCPIAATSTAPSLALNADLSLPAWPISL